MKTFWWVLLAVVLSLDARSDALPRPIPARALSSTAVYLSSPDALPALCDPLTPHTGPAHPRTRDPAAKGWPMAEHHSHVSAVKQLPNDGVTDGSGGGGSPWNSDDLWNVWNVWNAAGRAVGGGERIAVRRGAGNGGSAGPVAVSIAVNVTAGGGCRAAGSWGLGFHVAPRFVSFSARDPVHAPVSAAERALFFNATWDDPLAAVLSASTVDAATGHAETRLFRNGSHATLTTAADAASPHRLPVPPCNTSAAGLARGCAWGDPFGSWLPYAPLSCAAGEALFAVAVPEMPNHSALPLAVVDFADPAAVGAFPGCGGATGDPVTAPPGLKGLEASGVAELESMLGVGLDPACPMAGSGHPLPPADDPGAEARPTCPYFEWTCADEAADSLADSNGASALWSGVGSSPLAPVRAFSWSGAAPRDALCDQTTEGGGWEAAARFSQRDDQVFPATYSMLNGDIGGYNYWDEPYSGSGSPTTTRSPLSGGLGQLTDGIIGGDYWYADLGNGNSFEWVAWTGTKPKVTFDFGATVTIGRARSHHTHDSLSGVYLPTSIEFTWGSTTACSDGAHTRTTTVGAPDYNTLEYVAKWYETVFPTAVTARYLCVVWQSPVYMFMSEVEFFHSAADASAFSAALNNAANPWIHGTAGAIESDSGGGAAADIRAVDWRVVLAAGSEHELRQVCKSGDGTDPGDESAASFDIAHAFLYNGRTLQRRGRSVDDKSWALYNGRTIAETTTSGARWNAGGSGSPGLARFALPHNGSLAGDTALTACTGAGWAMVDPAVACPAADLRRDAGGAPGITGLLTWDEASGASGSPGASTCPSPLRRFACTTTHTLANDYFAPVALPTPLAPARPGPHASTCMYYLRRRRGPESLAASCQSITGAARDEGAFSGAHLPAGEGASGGGRRHVIEEREMLRERIRQRRNRGESVSAAEETLLGEQGLDEYEGPLDGLWGIVPPAGVDTSGLAINAQKGGGIAPRIVYCDMSSADILGTEANPARTCTDALDARGGIGDPGADPRFAIMYSGDIYIRDAAGTGTGTGTGTLRVRCVMPADALFPGSTRAWTRVFRQNLAVASSSVISPETDLGAGPLNPGNPYADPHSVLHLLRGADSSFRMPAGLELMLRYTGFSDPAYAGDSIIVHFVQEADPFDLDTVDDTQASTRVPGLSVLQWTRSSSNADPGPFGATFAGLSARLLRRINVTSEFPGGSSSSNNNNADQATILSGGADDSGNPMFHVGFLGDPNDPSLCANPPYCIRINATLNASVVTLFARGAHLGEWMGNIGDVYTTNARHSLLPAGFDGAQHGVLHATAGDKVHAPGTAGWIRVDPSHTYEYAIWTKYNETVPGDTAPARNYVALAPYDASGSFISSNEVLRYTGAVTIVAWNDTFIETAENVPGSWSKCELGAFQYTRGLGFYFGGAEHVADETKRVSAVVIESSYAVTCEDSEGAAGFLNYTGKLLRLASPLPASVTAKIVPGVTQIMAHHAGGTYLYFPAGNSIILPAEWGRFGAQISGYGYQNMLQGGLWRPETVYAVPRLLSSYQSMTRETLYKGVSWRRVFVPGKDRMPIFGLGPASPNGGPDLYGPFAHHTMTLPARAAPVRASAGFALLAKFSQHTWAGANLGATITANFMNADDPSTIWVRGGSMGSPLAPPSQANDYAGYRIESHDWSAFLVPGRFYHLVQECTHQSQAYFGFRLAHVMRYPGFLVQDPNSDDLADKMIPLFNRSDISLGNHGPSLNWDTSDYAHARLMLPFGSTHTGKMLTSCNGWAFESTACAAQGPMIGMMGILGQPIADGALPAAVVPVNWAVNPNADIAATLPAMSVYGTTNPVRTMSCSYSVRPAGDAVFESCRDVARYHPSPHTGVYPIVPRASTATGGVAPAPRSAFCDFGTWIPGGVIGSGSAGTSGDPWLLLSLFSQQSDAATATEPPLGNWTRGAAQQVPSRPGPADLGTASRVESWDWLEAIGPDADAGDAMQIVQRCAKGFSDKDLVVVMHDVMWESGPPGSGADVQQPRSGSAAEASAWGTPRAWRLWNQTVLAYPHGGDPSAIPAVEPTSALYFALPPADAGAAGQPFFAATLCRGASVHNASHTVGGAAGVIISNGSLPLVDQALSVDLGTAAFDGIGCGNGSAGAADAAVGFAGIGEVDAALSPGDPRRPEQREGFQTPIAGAGAALTALPNRLAIRLNYTTSNGTAVGSAGVARDVAVLAANPALYGLSGEAMTCSYWYRPRAASSVPPPPTVVSVGPPIPVATGLPGPVMITLTGTGFTQGPVGIVVETGPATPPSSGENSKPLRRTCITVNVVSDTEVTCEVPPLADAGDAVPLVSAVEVRVANRDAVPHRTPVAHAPPVVSGCLPATVPVTYAGALTVLGSNFGVGPGWGNLDTLEIGGVACPSPYRVSGTEIVCPAPAFASSIMPVLVGDGPAAAANVTRGTQGLASAAPLASCVAKVLSPPTLISVNPTPLPTCGSFAVTLSGSDFRNTTRIEFGRPGTFVAGNTSAVVFSACADGAVSSDDTLGLSAVCGSPPLLATHIGDIAAVRDLAGSPGVTSSLVGGVPGSSPLSGTTGGGASLETDLTVPVPVRVTTPLTLDPAGDIFSTPATVRLAPLVVTLLPPAGAASSLSTAVQQPLPVALLPPGGAFPGLFPFSTTDPGRTVLQGVVVSALEPWHVHATGVRLGDGSPVPGSLVAGAELWIAGPQAPAVSLLDPVSSPQPSLRVCSAGTVNVQVFPNGTEALTCVGPEAGDADAARPVFGGVVVAGHPPCPGSSLGVVLRTPPTVTAVTPGRIVGSAGGAVITLHGWFLPTGLSPILLASGGGTAATTTPTAGPLTSWVSVAGINCTTLTVLPATATNGASIVCTTGRHGSGAAFGSTTGAMASGPVRWGGSWPTPSHGPADARASAGGPLGLVASFPASLTVSYFAEPEVTSISPSTGPRTGGFNITIIGRFLGDSAADISAVTPACVPSTILVAPAAVSDPDTRVLTCTAADADASSVTATDPLAAAPDGTPFPARVLSAVGVPAGAVQGPAQGSMFTYVGGPGPVISSVIPGSLRSGSSLPTTVTIRGSGFPTDAVAAPTIVVGAATCTVTTSTSSTPSTLSPSDTEITCTIAAGAVLGPIGPSAVSVTWGGPSGGGTPSRSASFGVEIVGDHPGYQWVVTPITAAGTVENTPAAAAAGVGHTVREFPDGADVSPAGLKITVTLTLGQPTADVTLRLPPGNRVALVQPEVFSTAQSTLLSSPPALETTITFPATGNEWSVGRTVVLVGIEDRLRLGNTTELAMFSAETADPRYAGVAVWTTSVDVLDAFPLITSLGPTVTNVAGRTIVVTGDHFDLAGVRVLVGGVPAVSVVVRDDTGTAGLTRRRLGAADHRSGGGNSTSPVATVSSATGRVVEFVSPPIAEPGYKTVVLWNNITGSRVSVEGAIFYTEDCPEPGQFGRGFDCGPCPTGGFCPGGFRVRPLPGYWNPGEDSGYVVECRIPEACIGCLPIETPEGCYAKALCVYPYTGEACSKCEPNHYKQSSGACAACPSVEGFYLTIFGDLLVWGLISLCCWVLEEEEAIAKTVAFVLGIQMAAGVGSMVSHRLPDALIFLYEYLAIFSGDVRFLKPDCQGKIDFVLEFALAMAYTAFLAIPIIGGVPLAGLVSRLRHRKYGDEVLAERAEHYRNRTYRAASIYFTLAYYAVTQRGLSALTCRRRGDGVRTLSSEPELVCFQGAHLPLSIAGAVLLSVWTIGWPMSYFWFHRRHRTTEVGQTVRHRERYDFLYEPFIDRFRYSYFVEFAAFVGISLSSTVLTEHPRSQLGITVATFTAIMACVLIFRPFSRNYENYLSAVQCLSNILAGVVIYLNKDAILSPSAETVLVYALVGSIAVVVIALFTVTVTALFARGRGSLSPAERAELYDPNAICDRSSGSSVVAAGVKAGGAGGRGMGSSIHDELAISREERARAAAEMSRAFGLPPNVSLGKDVNDNDNDNDNDNEGFFTPVFAMLGGGGTGGAAGASGSNGTNANGFGMVAPGDWEPTLESSSDKDNEEEEEEEEGEATARARAGQDPGRGRGKGRGGRGGVGGGGGRLPLAPFPPSVQMRARPEAGFLAVLLARFSPFAEQPDAPPAYWTSPPEQNFAVVDVTEQLRDTFQSALDATCRSELIGGGADVKKKKDAHTHTHKGFRVLSVHRVENRILWGKYAAARLAMARRDEERGTVAPRIKTALAATPLGSLVPLNEDVGELILLHGTTAPPDVIEREGFDERVAGAGLFGAATYFAECSSKSDEYCEPQGGGSDGPCVMYAARVTMGTPYVALRGAPRLTRPPCIVGHAIPGCKHPRFDAVLAITTDEDERAILTKYREFAVYDRSQTLPEFRITYERV